MKALKVIFGILAILGACGICAFEWMSGMITFSQGVLGYLNAEVMLAILMVIAAIFCFAGAGKSASGADFFAIFFFLLSAGVAFIDSQRVGGYIAVAGVDLVVAIVLIVGHIVARRSMHKQGMFTREQFTGEIPPVDAGAAKRMPRNIRRRVPIETGAVQQPSGVNQTSASDPVVHGKHARHAKRK